MSCNYISSIPTSPNIDFALDQSVAYFAPVGSNINFNVDETYVSNQIISFQYPVLYFPSGNEVNFNLICSDNLSEISVIGNVLFDQLISDSEIIVTLIVTGDDLLSDLQLIQSSTIDRGNLVRSNAHIKTKVESDGHVIMIPFVMDAVNEIGSGEITSQSGIIIVAVIELGQNISFSDAISHLRGRVIFGYPEAPIIRQVYEMSNNRSLVIPDVPEEAQYAVFLTTTDFNLTDEELKRGTVDIEFEFGHDVKDIVKISVWIKTPSGFISLDRMKIFDYPGGQTEPHILYNPFKYSSVYRVPIHCISKRENEFFIEVEYKSEEIQGTINRFRTMRENEKYIIPFQAHFDNRNPYLNIADHSFVSGSDRNTNIYSSFVYDEIKQTFYVPDDDVTTGISQGANENNFFESEYVLITQIFCNPDEDVAYITHGGGNPNIYFIQESDDLSSIQIGG